MKRVLESIRGGFARHVRLAGVATALACAVPVVEAGSLVGLAQPGCAPADGPAVEIYLGQEPWARPDPRVLLDSLATVPMVRDSAAHIGRTDFVRLMLWDSPERLRGRRLDLTGDGRYGDIQQCDPHVGCERVPGSVTVERWDGTVLTGRLERRSPTGELQSWSFRARWVDRQVLCG